MKRADLRELHLELLRIAARSREAPTIRDLHAAAEQLRQQMNEPAAEGASDAHPD